MLDLRQGSTTLFVAADMPDGDNGATDADDDGDGATLTTSLA